MAKNEKKTAEKDLKQVSGGFIGSPTVFTQAGYQGESELTRRNRELVRTAHKEPKHPLGPYVQEMKNKLEGKL